ncbi:hypothetical protein HVIM_04198 [Roseomonas mucosa]|nr:hypothetical protein HVIM_04198 [Roseomonas mucosa]QDD98675.1 hypothetical protein ADP8_04198 [Roseomonas mucosa]UZO90871.1 hypothetical protein RMP42_04198 [Roseomonas mucosa]
MREQPAAFILQAQKILWTLCCNYEAGNVINYYHKEIFLNRTIKNALFSKNSCSYYIISLNFIFIYSC